MDSSDDEDGTESAAESFAAMARMTENYRRAAERYTAEDIANLNDVHDEDEFNTLERGMDSPERQWHVLKSIAKTAVDESAQQRLDYQARVVSLFRGMKKVGPNTLLEGMDEVVAKTAPVGLLPCEVWIPEGCQLYTMGEPEFIDIEVVLDSGAGLHVGNRKHFPGYTVEPNDLSKAGAGFVAADGGVIDNQGEVLLQMTTTDGRGGEHAISSKFHVADVTRALWSVGVICDAGLEARFTSEAAVVQKPDGTPVCHFTRKKGLYITKARIRNPNFEGFRRQAS